MFSLQALQPHARLRACELPFCFLCQWQVICSLRLSYQLHLSVHGQAFQAVFADRLQHHETWLRSLLLCLLQQALIDERGNSIQGLPRIVPIVKRRADCLNRLQGTAAYEDGEPSEESLLCRI